MKMIVQIDDEDDPTSEPNQLLMQESGLNNKFERQAVIDGVDHGLHEGGAVPLREANGSGKIAHVYILAGNLTSDADIIRFVTYGKDEHCKSSPRSMQGLLLFRSIQFPGSIRPASSKHSGDALLISHLAKKCDRVRICRRQSNTIITVGG